MHEAKTREAPRMTIAERSLSSKASMPHRAPDHAYQSHSQSRDRLTSTSTRHSQAARAPLFRLTSPPALSIHKVEVVVDIPLHTPSVAFHRPPSAQRRFDTDLTHYLTLCLESVPSGTLLPRCCKGSMCSRTSINILKPSQHGCTSNNPTISTPSKQPQPPRLRRLSNSIIIVSQRATMQALEVEALSATLEVTLA